MAERETLETDVLVVGGGPAGLAAAMRFKDLLDAHNGTSGSPLEASVMVVEKAAEFGAHNLSGAVLDPSSLRELVPDFEAKGAPVSARVTGDEVRFLTSGGEFRLPFVPPGMHNDGCSIVSLNQLVKWLAEQAEARGIDLFPGFAASELLIEEGKVVGVRTGDKGIDKHGTAKGNFEPGMDLRAKVTILAEGARGSLTKVLVEKLHLDAGKLPMVYSVGLKELWEVPKGRVRKGGVIHTMGWPLDSATFGGGFVYGLEEDRLALGLVIGLDYHDPLLDPHGLFQKLKTHPSLRPLLEGGKLLRYGARTISEGGWHSIPRPYADGVLLVGEAAGYLNAMRLKGIHLALKTGMLAAEAALDALVAGDTSARQLASFESLVAASSVKKELWPVRNFHQGFKHGLWGGMIHAGAQFATGGRGFVDPLAPSRGHAEMRTLAAQYGFQATARQFRARQGRRRADVRPAHRRLRVGHQTRGRPADPPPRGGRRAICETRCREEYGNPCERFCPAASLRDGAEGRRFREAALRSTSRTASTARPATSWTPTRSSRG